MSYTPVHQYNSHRTDTLIPSTRVFLNMTSRNTEIMLSLLQSALWGGPMSTTVDAGDDTEAVLREMRDHAVMFLPDSLPGDHPLWRQAQAENLVTNIRLAYVQQCCFDALDAVGINAIVLKGSAVALYYPKPERRSCGDIDLLVTDEDFERASRTLADLCGMEGYQSGRHVSFSMTGVSIELHWYFSDYAILDARLKAAIPRGRTAELFGMRFRMLPPVENGLAVLDHIRHHLVWGQLGMKQVVDWMMFVDGELKDEAAFEAFFREAGKYQLDMFAAAMTQMCRIYLGLPGEYSVFKDSALCEDLLACFIDSGNFGRKRENARSRTIGALTAMHGGVLRHLWREGAKNDADERRKTKLFRCSRQVLRYVRLGLKNGQGFVSLRQDLRESRRKARLFRQLGLKEE